MKRFTKLAVSALFAASALALTATSAAAYIACNGEGQCWHVHRQYVYRPQFGVVIHSDDWRWGQGERYEWREHRGRGYWRNGLWVRF